MREVLLFLVKFLILSAVLFVGFKFIEEPYSRVLAHTTATLAPLTGSSVKVVEVRGNAMALHYAGKTFTETMTFAAFNPVVLISLLLSTPGVGRRILVVGIGGLCLLLLAQVVTLRLLLAIDLRGYRGTPGLETLEILTLASICVNWVLPIVIWVAFVPTGFLARALKGIVAPDRTM